MMILFLGAMLSVVLTKVASNPKRLMRKGLVVSWKAYKQFECRSRRLEPRYFKCSAWPS